MNLRTTSLILLIIASAGGQASAQSETAVALNLPLTLTGDVLPGSTSVSLPFSISGATGLMLNVIVPVDGAQLSLRDPSGTTLIPPGDPAVQFTTGRDLTGSQAFPGGVFVVAEISSPANGTWTLLLQFPAAPVRTVVQATVLVRTPVQVGVVLERESYVTGEDIAIGLLVLRDGLPLGSASIAGGPLITVARVGGPGGPTVETALDNGLNPDGLADDGIYSVEYTFPSPGIYEINGSVDLATQEGLLTRSARRRVVVRDPGLAVLATGSSILAGPGGCGQGIQLTVDTDVNVAAAYLVRASLVGSNGLGVEAHVSQNLATGARLINVRFDGDALRQEIGVDGPYTIDGIEILQRVDEAFSVAYRAADVGQTPPFPLNGVCLAPVDLRAELTVNPTLVDGFIGSVNLSFPITVNTAGSYSISFKVIGAAGQDVELIGGPRTLSVGRNDVNFTIPASLFLSSDGPYQVISLLVIGAGGSAQLAQVGSTPLWNRWQFLPRINGDLDNDGDVDAVDRDVVLAARNVRALVPGDRRDLNRDGIIDLRDARLIAIMRCATGACPVR